MYVCLYVYAFMHVYVYNIYIYTYTPAAWQAELSGFGGR